MTRVCKRMKKASIKEKLTFYSLIAFFAVVLIISIKSTMAYYEDIETPIPIIAASVGDFDVAGDINIVIFKKVDGKYVKTLGVPAVGYSFVEGSTKCYSPVSKTTSISCSRGTSGDCHYTFDQTKREFALTSKQKVTCEFYFDKTMTSDIDTLIYIESSVADVTYQGRNYQLTNSVPTTGYTLSAQYCSNPTAGSVQVSGTQVTVSSTTQNKCYVYYNKSN